MQSRHAVILVYDASSVNSKISLERWKNLILNIGGLGMKILILGNKIDLL